MKTSFCSTSISILLLFCCAAGGQTTANCNFNNFDFPNSGFTAVTGINDSGVLAGTFDDWNEMYTNHGFVATCQL